MSDPARKPNLVSYLNGKAARRLTDVLGVFLHPTVWTLLVVLWLGCCVGSAMLLAYQMGNHGDVQASPVVPTR